jgi:hypothetical protein
MKHTKKLQKKLGRRGIEGRDLLPYAADELTGGEKKKGCNVEESRLELED